MSIRKQLQLVGIIRKLDYLTFDEKVLMFHCAMENALLFEILAKK